jgi:hypothetical protein
MIDWLVNRIFSWDSLRHAVTDEVHLYDQLNKVMSDPECMATSSRIWLEEDGWKGWAFNRELNRYIFNDIGGGILDTLDLTWRLDEYNMDEIW